MAKRGRGGAKSGREAKKSARGKVWHSIAPQEDGSAPGGREDIGGDVWAAEDTVICHGQCAVGGQKGKIWAWIMIRPMWTQRASTRPHTAGWNEQDERDDGVYGCASTGARVWMWRPCVYKYVHEMGSRQKEVWSGVETNEQNVERSGGGGGIFLNKSETQAQPDSDRVQSPGHARAIGRNGSMYGVHMCMRRWSGRAKTAA